MIQDLSESQVEEWLLRNREAADRIFEKNALAVDAKVRKQNEFYSKFYEMAKMLNSYLDVELILKQLSKSAVELIRAERCSIFLLENDDLNSIIFDVHSQSGAFDSVQVKVKKGHGIVGTVAATEKCLNIADAYSNPLFSPAVDKETKFRTQSLLSMPIFEPTEGKRKLVGVANLINKVGIDESTGKSVVTAFTAEDESAFDSVLVLVGIALRNAKLYQCTYTMVQENLALYKITDKDSKRANFLLTLASKIGVENNTKDLASRILQYYRLTRFAKSITNADTTSLFLLYSKVVTGGNEETLYFPINRGIEGRVYRTGCPVNIEDVANDSDFLSDLDKKKNYKTQSMLCVPIYGNDRNILGIASLINKIDPETGKIVRFTVEDQYNFEAFAVFFGLALGKAIIMEKMAYEKRRLEIALELMSFHSQIKDQELSNYMDNEESMFVDPKTLTDYMFDCHMFDNTDDKLCAITHQLFRITNYEKEYDIDVKQLIEYILTIRRNYRPVAYHNFTHGVSVAHTLFLFIVNGVLDEYFDKLDLFAMLVAALNHDIDHRGTNNNFHKQTGSVLSSFYASSTMERHHFNHAMTILNSGSNLNIFERLSMEDYRRCLHIMEVSILATDLNVFLVKNKEAERLLTAGEFSAQNLDHVELLRCITMTCCDLGSMFKPFTSSQKTAELVFAEFFEQGDLEQSSGLQYSSEVTNRANKHKIPKMQAGFLKFIAIPAYKTFTRMLNGKLDHLLEKINFNLECWESLAEDGDYTFKESLGNLSEKRNSRASSRVKTPKRENSTDSVHSTLLE